MILALAHGASFKTLAPNIGASFKTLAPNIGTSPAVRDLANWDPHGQESHII